MAENFSEKTSNISDDELVRMVNGGDYGCLQTLINRYMPYIISEASSYNIGGFDTEDFIQEGVVALFSAVKSFNSEKASFKTFVKICIDRAMLSALARVSGGAKHIPQSLITPIDDVELSDSNSPESIIIGRESYNDLAFSIKQCLSDFEYRVLSEFLSGKSYVQIAEKLSVSTKSVDNALKRVRKKIKQK